MNTKHTLKSWYVEKTGNDQGLIVDEKNGDNIAVAYKKEHAPLISAAPDLLEACIYALDGLTEVREGHFTLAEGTLRKLNDAIRKAEGN